METVTYGGKTTTYAYDENGRRKSINYNGGVTENYTYDKDNQLKHLANKKPNGVIISEYKYTYDLTGRQLSKTDSYGTTNYDYDKVGRITKVTTPGKTTVYAYDKAGNRVSLNETYTSLQPSEYIDEATGKDIQYILKKSDYTYSSSNTLLKLVERIFDQNNKELARKTTKYVYDDNGNQIRQSASHILPDDTKLRPATVGTAYGDNLSGDINKLVQKSSYTYDGFNRLKKTENVKAGVRSKAEYTYNGDDLRVSKTVKKSDKGYIAEVTNYLYDRQNVILETDAAGTVKARYIKGINYIAKIDTSNKQSYFLFNGHGDVVQTVDEAGTLQNQYDYDIWGNPTLTVETLENAIRYSGEFMDSETGLYYLRARYYDPNIGRFISEDSYWGEDENPLSLNLYTYCHNNPVRYTDPSGHKVLAVGSKGNDVKQLQKNLINLGYDLGKYGADGSYGKDTKRAVEQYQKDHKLKLDGKVGNQTITSVNTAVGIKDVPSANLTDAAKKQIQEEADKTVSGPLPTEPVKSTQNNNSYNFGNIKTNDTNKNGLEKTTETKKTTIENANSNNKNGTQGSSYSKEFIGTILSTQVVNKDTSTGLDRFNEKMGINMSTYGQELGKNITDFFTGEMAEKISRWFEKNGQTISNGPAEWSNKISDYFSVKENNPSYKIDQYIKSFINADSDSKIDKAADIVSWIIWNGVWAVATDGMVRGMGASDDLLKGISNSSDDIAKGASKTISYTDYDNIYQSSIHNAGKNKVMLGKYDGGGSTSYINKAGKDYEYFNLGDDWNKIKKQYGYTDDDMFKLFNESFLDDGINAGKSFTFSHNPIGDTGALGQEYAYLKRNGYVYNSSSMTMVDKNK